MKRSLEDFPQEKVPELISYLKRLEQKGIKSLYLGRAVASPDPVESEAHRSKPGSQPESHEASAPTSRERDAVHKPGGRTTMTDTTTNNTTQLLVELQATVNACTDCGLHEGRTNGVFGTGSHTTSVMFIGEGPGRDEDMQGKPFVGRSGQLLTKMIAAIDLTRDDVYITNIVKCRPPNNRDPQEEEVRCCEKYLIRQIALIRPRVICALGRISAHWLLQTNESLASLRQSDNQYQDTPVLVTYHPAALLRNPNLKRDAWEDFKKLRSMIND
jgi:DNA polymerase